MKHVYITDSGLENENNEAIEVPAATVAAAKRGTVTDKLCRAVRAALNEEVALVDRRAMKKFYATGDAHGMISHLLEADSLREAKAELIAAIESGEARRWVDDTAQDLDESEVDDTMILDSMDGWDIRELRG